MSSRRNLLATAVALSRRALTSVADRTATQEVTCDTRLASRKLTAAPTEVAGDRALLELDQLPIPETLLARPTDDCMAAAVVERYNAPGLQRDYPQVRRLFRATDITHAGIDFNCSSHSNHQVSI
jgi:hypothetical protein